MKVFLFSLLIFFFLSLVHPLVDAAMPSDFSTASHGAINTIKQNSISIDVSTRFDNFLTYTSQLYNNDCYNDANASFELYSVETGEIISSQVGESHCYSLDIPNQSLFFPPLQLATGNYFIHYLGNNGSEWITNSYAYTADVPVHNRPMTNSSLSPIPTVLAENLLTYVDPVSVSLYATADTGFSISHIYYKLDGGSQQTYSAPFMVSGTGTHSIEYWSLDNSGLAELDHQVRYFMINPMHGRIQFLAENEEHIGVSVQFTNFEMYMATLFNNDCYNDPAASFELYHVETGGVVVTRTGYSYCRKLDDGSTWLSFPSASLTPGRYFIHYHGGNNSEWITDAYTYPASEVTPTINLQPTNTPAVTLIPTHTITPMPTVKPSSTPAPTPTNKPLPTPSPTLLPTPTAFPTVKPTVSPSPTISSTPNLPLNKLTALAPAKIWLSLKNPSDLTITLDLKAEIFKNNSLISSGQVESISPGMGIMGFASASQHSMKFNAISQTSFPVGTNLKIKLSARNACRGSLRNAGIIRLWYGDKQATTQFGATVDGKNKMYYLTDAFLLSPLAGTGMKKSIDVQAGGRCSDFKPFGTWTMSL